MNMGLKWIVYGEVFIKYDWDTKMFTIWNLQWAQKGHILYVITKT